jgi:predicted pyridoxine 5'-phosphate oxidase superfamily flavin-nucleotide-binding protein
MNLSDDIINFFSRQDFVIVSTIDKNGNIHTSAKGLVGLKDKEYGRVLLLDLFFNETYRNLQNNPTISITAIDNNSFIGYTLQGKADIVPREKIPLRLLQEWDDLIVSRISKRMIRNVKVGVKSEVHHEMKLPVHPKYLIEVIIDHIVDLSINQKNPEK